MKVVTNPLSRWIAAVVLVVGHVFASRLRKFGA